MTVEEAMTLKKGDRVIVIENTFCEYILPVGRIVIFERLEYPEWNGRIILQTPPNLRWFLHRFKLENPLIEDKEIIL